MKKDSRLLYFNKWILPKISSFSSVKGVNAFAVGHFDSIKVIPLSGDEYITESPLVDFINHKCAVDENEIKNLMSCLGVSNLSNLNSDYSSQQLMIFTNVGEEDIDKAVYDEDKTRSFWKETSALRFYSLLHIENGADINNVYNILKKINNAFSQKQGCEQYRAICYFSLDYSDIIICAKDISVMRFSEIVFDINFNNKTKFVKDSFSLLCIDSSVYKNVFFCIENDLSLDENFCKDEKSKKLFVSEKYNIAFNIGVQNNEVFKEFLSEIKKYDLYKEESIYKLLGRHDVSIINENANLLWLIKMSYFIDKYSTQGKTPCGLILDRKSVLFNCEMYLRIALKNEEISQYVDEKRKEENTRYSSNGKGVNKDNIYEHALKILDNEIEGCLKCEIENEYLISILTLRSSILGLLKNGFAEDFVLCIFESFVAFLRYIEEHYVHDKAFDLCFDNYFNIISAISNSAMHSERHFIQSPSFNPVFFDVPPKLMAYYTALTSIINEIISTDKDNNYSFVFKPSFLYNIEVSSYSYADFPPTDRLLAVTIREKDLYYPFSVISQMCHEVAHYVGDKNRNREERKERFLKNALYYIIYEYFKQIKIDDNLETGIVKWLKSIVDNIKELKCYQSNEGFSDSYKKLLYYSLIHICEEDYIDEKSRKYLFDKEISEIEFSIKNSSFKKYLLSCVSDILRTNSVLYEKIDIIANLFYEDYADVQMALILNMSLKEYLNTFENHFKKKHDLNERTFEELVHSDLKTYGRIFSVVALFTLKEHWKVEKDNQDELTKIIYRDLNLYIKYHNEFKYRKKELYGPNLEDTISKLKEFGVSKWESHMYIISNIQRYLIEVYDSSSKNYKEKNVLINELNSNIRAIDAFDNAAEIFSIIQETNDKYAEKIFLLNKELNDI